MKTIENLITECEAEIGQELTQIILSNDIENPILNQYNYGNEPSRAAIRLAAALGNIDILHKFNYPAFHDDYSVIKTAIEHRQLKALEMTSSLSGVSKGVLQDDAVLKQHITQAISDGDFHILRYLAEKNTDVAMEHVMNISMYNQSRQQLEAMMFLVDIAQLPIPAEYRCVFVSKVHSLRVTNSDKVSEEQSLLWAASCIRLGIFKRFRDPDAAAAILYINGTIPFSFSKGKCKKLLSVGNGELDNTKVQFAYMYAKGLVPPEVMNEVQFISLLNSIEIENLTTESIRYLGATFQFMLQETPDSVFTNGEASIDTLTKYYAFYSALISGDKETAKNIFETLPEIERTGAAYYHYANILLDLYGMKSSDSECQDVLICAYSAFESAVKKGSDLAGNQLTFYQKGLDGSIIITGIPERSSTEDDLCLEFNFRL